MKTVKIFGHTVPLHDVIIVKIIVCVGILSVHFLPPHHAVLVNTATNVLWLFKT
jgi:hypothetical protein